MYWVFEVYHVFLEITEILASIPVMVLTGSLCLNYPFIDARTYMSS